MPYIYKKASWPSFTWNAENTSLLEQLALVRHKQGLLLGRMRAIGMEYGLDATLENLTLDVLKTSEIEGEILQLNQVRSSLARRLGMDIAGLVPSNRHTDGIVDIIVDATTNYRRTLTKERLFEWHQALFPLGKSGQFNITTGQWRTDKNGPMQVVSGAYGREYVHFQAPEAALLPLEMEKFLKWINEETYFEPVLKAAIAHLWFITLHPFEDGNGRIARAISDMLLARAEQSNLRYYSMSAEIRRQRNAYYAILERSQKGDLDVTEWILWFLQCLLAAIERTNNEMKEVLKKTTFWETHRLTSLNERQRLILNMLLDGFEGNLTNKKWSVLSKCSPDTALRDLQDLVEKGILEEIGGGRSTAYRFLYKPQEG